ncbi:Methyltransferase small domain-containing protein [Brevibacterium sandarakinum]|uniref:Methyltransferase small domain-containing protein n=1 Tax=Brevibacterium sandarakinum TaxID=629680 RepID=A0A1H1VT29_BRESA|nr:methyltransferase [Brevibacterium sandarakinum]SDS88118.1 Methyltransferase small domain-containing protein [Brevibacterium sandarakinum]
MAVSLLAAESTAADARSGILARFPDLAHAPGLPQARMLVDFVLGYRSGELDVSGRPTAGTFVSAEAVAGLPKRVILVDDAHGTQARLLTELALVHAFNDRIDQSRIVAAAAPTAEVVEQLAAHVDPPMTDIIAETVPDSSKNPTDPARTWAIVNAPKAVDDLSETIAALQPQVSTVIVIGRSDSMSRAVNKELARGFARVDVSPGVGKHRMIIGSRALSSPSMPSFPKHGIIDHSATGPFQVRAHGACFSGVKSDEGSAALLEVVAAEVGSGSPESVLDLGCGNGWLLSAAMRVTAAVKGTGVDVSKAAVASAKETAEANGLEVETVLADATDAEAVTEPGSGLVVGGYDLILLNPPFHQGTAIETDTAAGLMRTASLLLAPGGQVVTVFNSHLRYRDSLERLIGPSEQAARTSKFTVIRSRG